MPKPRQTSIQLTPQTEKQIAALRQAGFGTRTDIIRIALDRMHNQENGNALPELRKLLKMTPAASMTWTVRRALREIRALRE